MTGDDLRALSAAATLAPWYGPASQDGRVGTEQHAAAYVGAGPQADADAALIVWLRNHADALADLIDAATSLHDLIDDAGGGRVPGPHADAFNAVGVALAALDADA